MFSSKLNDIWKYLYLYYFLIWHTLFCKINRVLNSWYAAKNNSKVLFLITTKQANRIQFGRAVSNCNLQVLGYFDNPG